MDTTTILIGIFVGWAAVIGCGGTSTSTTWLMRMVGVVGGLIGAYLAVMIGGGESLEVAVCAWAGAVILGDLVSMVNLNPV